ncbi:unnamed protein product [Effrenium voratum]|nr:unnamed protein product [Effrenium voratum]
MELTQLQRRFAQEAEQREALQRGLHRLRRSAELCRERLATGELRPLDALRPLELDVQEVTRSCSAAAPSWQAGASAGSYELLRNSLQAIQQQCEEQSASMLQQTQVNDSLEQALAATKASSRKLEGELQEQEENLQRLRRQHATDAERLQELRRKSKSEAEEREREACHRHEQAAKELAETQRRERELLTSKLTKMQRGLASAKDKTRSLREALDKTSLYAMQRELQAGLGCIEQKVLANLSSYLRLQKARQSAAEKASIELELQIASEAEKQQQESFQTAQQQALLAADTADLQARSSREIERLSAQLQRTSNSLAAERSLAIQEQSRRERQTEVVQAQRQDAEAALERARQDVQSLQTAEATAKEELYRQQEALQRLRMQMRETRDSLSLVTNGNEHLKVQLAEFRARSRRVQQEEEATRKSAHVDELLAWQKTHEARLVAAQDQAADLEREIAAHQAEATAWRERLASTQQEVEQLQEEIPAWRAQCSEITSSRQHLQDAAVKEEELWAEERLSLKKSLELLLLQVEQLEDSARASEKVAERAEAANKQWQSREVERLEAKLREAKAELTDAKRRLAAENDALQKVSMELEQKSCEASLARLDWDGRPERQATSSGLRDKERWAEVSRLHQESGRQRERQAFLRQELEHARLLLDVPTSEKWIHEDTLSSAAYTRLPVTGDVQWKDAGEDHRLAVAQGQTRLSAVLAENERLKRLVSQVAHSPLRQAGSPRSPSIYEPVTPQSRSRRY